MEMNNFILQVSRRVYFKYTGAIGCFASCIILLLFTIYQASAIGANIWLSQWTDDSYLKTHQNESNTTEYQDKNNLYLGVYGGLGAAQGMLKACLQYRFQKSSSPLMWKLCAHKILVSCFVSSFLTNQIIYLETVSPWTKIFSWDY